MIGPTFTPEEIAKREAIELEAKEALKRRWARPESSPPYMPDPYVPDPMYYFDENGKIRRAPQP